MEKDSKLTPCVSEAIKTLESDGRLAQIEQEWMGEAAGAPELR